MQLSSPRLVNSAIQKAWEIAESVGKERRVDGVWFDSKKIFDTISSERIIRFVQQYYK